MADETKKVLLEVSVEVKEAIKNLAATKTQIQDLRKAQKELDTTTAEGKQMYEAYGAQIRELTKTSRDQQKQIDNTIKSNKEAEGSNEQLKAKLSLLTAEYNKLSKAQKESAEGVELKNSIKGISDELKGAEEGVGDFHRSIGDYQNSIMNSIGLSDGFICNLAKMSAGAKETGVSFGKQAVSGVVSLGKAFLSLMANPIVLLIAAIVLGLKGLYDILKSFDPVLDLLQQGFAAVSAIFSSFKDIVLSVITGQKSFKEALSGSAEAMSKAAKAAIEMKKAQQELDDMNWKATVNQEKYKNQINELLLQSKNRTLSEKERMKLIDQALRLEQQAFQEKKSIADQELRIAQLDIISKHNLTKQEIALLKSKGVEYAIALKDRKAVTDEEVKALADALAKQQQAEGESIAIREKAQNRRDQLEDKAIEAANKRAERAKEIKDKIAKAEVDIENIKSQSIIDKQNIISNNEKKTLSERIAALAVYEAEQIKIIERNRYLELNNTDLTEKEQKSIKAKAAYDIQNIKSDTEKAITSIEEQELDKRLRKSSEALEKRKQQLSDEQSAELVKLSADYANAASKAKSQEELTNLQKQYEKDKFDTAQKYREADFNASVDTLTSQLNLENLTAEQRIEIEKAVADAKSQYAQESAQIAIKANEDVVKNHEESAKQIEEIERQLKDKKEELYREIVSTINSIVDGNYQRQFERLNEETDRINKKYDKLIKEAKGNDDKQKKLDKDREKELDEVEAKRKKKIREQAIANRVFAVLNIILNTGSAVMAALAPPPIGLGPAAGLPLAVMAGGIGALQLAAALSAPLPQAGKGALLKGKSHKQGGIPIEAEGGEAIINKKSTAMFRPLLSAINQAGGGVSFGAGGIAGDYKYNDGGYAVRFLNNDNGLSKEDVKNAMEQAISKLKIYASIEDIRREDKKYTEIEDRATF